MLCGTQKILSLPIYLLMKKLAFLAAAATCLSLGSCKYDTTFDKDYEYDLVIPISATGTGQVESTVDQDIDLESAIKDETSGKGDWEGVNWIHVKEARIEMQDADGENNASNFSRATIDISKEDGGSKVSGGADIADEYATSINLDNAFGEQDLKGAIESKKLRYRVVFDARRATAKELPAKLHVKLTVHATITEL